MTSIIQFHPNSELNKRGYEGSLATLEEGLKYCPQETHPEEWVRLQNRFGRTHYRKADLEEQRFLDPRPFWRKAIESYELARDGLIQHLDTLQQKPEKNSKQQWEILQFQTLHLEIIQDLLKPLLALSRLAEAKQIEHQGLELYAQILNAQSTPAQKQRIEVQFSGFSQLGVDILIQDHNPKLALEAAERQKNRVLRWILTEWQEQVESPSYEQIRQLLDPHTAIIYWHLSSNSLTTFLLTLSDPDPVLLTSELTPSQQLQQLEDQIKAWKTDYQQATRGSKDSDKSGEPEVNWKDQLPGHLQKLNQILNLSALETHLKGMTHLILIPHRDLRILPLHALFPDHLTVTYLPSAQIGLRLRSSQQPLTSLLSLEHPQHKDLSLLLHSLIESQVLRQLFHDNTTSLGEQECTLAATKAALTTTNRTILHFNGHAGYNFFNPKLSCLYLTQEDQLTLADLMELPYRSPTLVSLSACETGLTRQQTIDTDYVGLVSAFLYRGARYAISTLWPIESEASALLMIHLYRDIANGIPAPTAYNQACHWLKQATPQQIQDLLNWIQEQCPQLEDEITGMRSNIEGQSTPPYADPYYWAAFTLTGL